MAREKVWPWCLRISVVRSISNSFAIVEQLGINCLSNALSAFSIRSSSTILSIFEGGSVFFRRGVHSVWVCIQCGCALTVDLG